MADEQEKKDGTGQDGGPPVVETPAPEATGENPPVQEAQTVFPGMGGPAPDSEVVVSFDKINELVKGKGTEQAAEQTQDDGGPAHPGELEPDDREEWEMSSAELEERRKAEKQQQRRRSRPAKEQGGEQGRATGKGKRAPERAADQTAKPGKAGRSKMVAAKGAPGPVTETPAVEPSAPVEVPKPIKDGELVYLRLDEVYAFHTFRPHPFQVRDDAKMMEMVESVKAHGVMTPGTVRPEKDGKGYECIAGHRRRRASELAGAEVMPFIVRHMSDHEAVQEMKASNKQREGALPSEIAHILDLEMEDIKHQGKSGADKVAPEDVGKSSIEIVARNNGMKVTKAKRYIRLNGLTPELLEMVDKKQLGFVPAADYICHIRPKLQEYLAVAIEGQQSSPTKEQAARMKELDEKGLLNPNAIDGILMEETREEWKVIISSAELEKYFSKDKTPREMKDQIISLLDEWKEKQPVQEQPQKKADALEK